MEQTKGTRQLSKYLKYWEERNCTYALLFPPSSLNHFTLKPIFHQFEIATVIKIPFLISLVCIVNLSCVFRLFFFLSLSLSSPLRSYSLSHSHFYLYQLGTIIVLFGAIVKDAEVDV